MRSPQRHIVVLTAILSCLLISGCSLSSAVVKRPNFIVEYAGVTGVEAQELADQAERTGRKVADFLGVSLSGPIRIRIDPNQEIPFATKEGAILLPPDRIYRKQSAVTHEITHVIARSAGRPDRFLDEGLGVYMQERFGEDPSYPNFGRNLHRLTLEVAGGVGGLIPLTKVESARQASKIGPERQLAYLEEGSFVKYLIEQYGIQRFMAMYRGQTSGWTYGKSLTELEQEWKDFLKSFK